ncbi:putative Cyclic nucleotide-gated ion channel [Quillaja saponaria]|uniref:Cyclic nucleotide-gated ion channel n=1 Tax=Quillaja saponaria TaxID=32244 RepID=A0AAD7LR01_QUISA|nr:putative Cyclic nucleotide-gated ion channel [Quillaja saponaria]
MDERLLDAICERLKPSLCTESTYIVREGDPVDEMLFIIRGRLESVTTDGGRSGFFNRVRAITEVEAFALEAEELKFVASQFRRLHSRQVQHTFRFYSQQWRTWASIFIQAAWRRYAKRKNAEKRRMKELEEEEEFDYDGEEDNDVKALDTGSHGSSRFGATIFASRFAANALRGHRLRSTSSRGLVKLQKPSEPDFTSAD